MLQVDRKFQSVCLPHYTEFCNDNVRKQMNNIENVCDLFLDTTPPPPPKSGLKQGH